MQSVETHREYSSDGLSYFPPAYHVLDHVVPHRLREFEPKDDLPFFTFAPAVIDPEDWFRILLERVEAAIGRTFLPVFRLGDGEYRFWLGNVPPSIRRPLVSRLKGYARYLYNITAPTFHAQTVGRYSSGLYTRREIISARAQYDDIVRKVLASGILAPALQFGPIPSLYEAHFPSLRERFAQMKCLVRVDTIAPVYFIYAMLSSSMASRLYQSRRILVITNASIEKQHRITHSLLDRGASDVRFVQVSERRSLFDKVQLSSSDHESDICFVGAGLGKANVFSQLPTLPMPCIDAGFMIEVWADPVAAGERPFTAPTRPPR